MEQEYIKSRITELCSEDAYGSWELWWSLGTKKPEEKYFLCNQFVEAIEELLREGKILIFRKSEHNQFSIVSLDRERLLHELQNSDHPKPLEFFWFDLENNKGRVAGTRYQYQDGRGVRVLPGNSNASDLVKRGAYSRIIDIDNVSDPTPLAGNPALEKNEL